MDLRDLSPTVEVASLVERQIPSLIAEVLAALRDRAEGALSVYETRQRSQLIGLSVVVCRIFGCGWSLS